MQNKAKIKKVMGEFKRGKLHSGSKSGPLVRDRDQAIAIALSEARRGYTEGGVARSEEAFQRWIRSLPWFKEFVGQYGEEPDLDTPDYDYRAAFRAGLTPTRHRDGTYHWPSSLDDGSLLKGPAHPTLYKEYFMRNSGVDPDDFGQLDPDVFATFVEPSRYAEGGLSRRGILGAIAGAAATAVAKKGKGLIDNAAPATERAVAKQVPHTLESLRVPQHLDGPIQDYLYDIALGGEDNPKYLQNLIDMFQGQADSKSVQEALDAVRAIQDNVRSPLGRYYVSRFHPSTSEPGLDDSLMDSILETVRGSGKKKYSVEQLIESTYDADALSGGPTPRNAVKQALEDLRNATHSRREDGTTVNYHDYIQSQIDDYLNRLLLR